MTAADSTAGASTSPSNGGWTPPRRCLPTSPVDLDWYTTREREYAEVLPWDHLDSGLDRDWLWEDWQDALNEVEVDDCRWTPCFDCGVCPEMGTEIQVGPTGRTCSRCRSPDGTDLEERDPRWVQEVVMTGCCGSRGWRGGSHARLPGCRSGSSRGGGRPVCILGGPRRLHRVAGRRHRHLLRSSGSGTVAGERDGAVRHEGRARAGRRGQPGRQDAARHLRRARQHEEQIRPAVQAIVRRRRGASKRPIRGSTSSGCSTR